MSEKRRCRARLSDGSRQCRNAPISGGAVCRYHGGAAPQVRASAHERLEALVDPAITGLQAALASEDVGRRSEGCTSGAGPIRLPACDEA